MKRIRIVRPKAQWERPWREALPLDPRDSASFGPRHSAAPPIHQEVMTK